jgi:hypothetical protein
MSDEEKNSPGNDELLSDTMGSDGVSPPEKERPGIFKLRRWRHMFMALMSLAVISIILIVTVKWPETILSTEKKGFILLVPYLTNLAGVLMFIMNTSRKKREKWSLLDYWGDHFFRIAESFAYLFIVLWAWNTAKEGGAVGVEIGPNIVGFLVGLFILRVERAMEALGDKFEETLMAILPRSVQYISAEERRRQQLKMVYKIDEVATQYDAVRVQIDDPGARAKIDQLVDSARKAALGEDPDQLAASVEELSRTFDDVKQTVGEVRVSVDEFLGKVIRAEGNTTKKNE